MSRIDVQTLVLAFERRIEALEKNPPDKVSTGVIINMLEKSIDEIIKDHFVLLTKKQMAFLVEKEMKKMHDKFVRKTLKSILEDEEFRKKIEKQIKDSIIFGIKIRQS